MPVGTHLHDSPLSGNSAAAVYSSTNIGANSPTPTSIPANYAGTYSIADLKQWPSGGILTTNTLEDLRKGTNQLASDFNTAIVSHQGQITKNANNVATLDVRGDQMQADLINIATDLSNKAFDTIRVTGGTGLNATGESTGLPDDTVNLQDDLTINLKVAGDSEIGGVLSNDTQTIENNTSENNITGHIEVDSSGNVKIKNNAIELGEKTRGDYIHNITATTADGITLTGGTGEKTTTDLKLTERITAATKGAISDEEESAAYTHTSGKIRKVLVPQIQYNKYGQLTTVNELQVNSANNSNVTVTAGNHIDGGGSFTLNHGAAQSVTLNHAAVNVQSDQTFTTDSPSASEVKYRTTDILSNIGFDAYGHVDSISKQELTYGLSADLSLITHNQYTRGDFHLNIPREADFKRLHDEVVDLKGDSVLIPTNVNNPINVSRKLHISGTGGPSDAWLRVDGSMSVAGNDSLNSPGDTTTAAALFVSKSNSNVGIGTSTPNSSYKLDVAGRARIRNDVEILGADVDLNNTIRRTFASQTAYDADPTAGVEPTGSTVRRAIVHEFGDRLRLNYAQDYSAGVMIGNDFVFQNDGKFGINTSNPTDALDVNGSGDFTGSVSLSDKLVLRGGQSANDTRIEIQASDNSNRYVIETDLDGSTGSDLLIFKTTAVSNAFVLKGDGKVGIGTTTPGFKLHVIGNGGFSTDLQVGRDLEVFNDLTVASNRLFVRQSDGQVGIGTSSPDKHLDIRNADVYIDNRKIVTRTAGNELHLYSDPTQNSGANLELYSTTHSSYPGESYLDANEFHVRPLNSSNSKLFVDNVNSFVGINTTTRPASDSVTISGTAHDFGPYEFAVTGDSRLSGNLFVGGKLSVSGISNLGGSVDYDDVSLDNVNAITMGGVLTNTLGTGSSSSTTGSIIIGNNGGLGVAQNIHAGGNIVASGSLTSNDLVVLGGASIGNQSSDAHSVQGTMTFNDATLAIKGSGNKTTTFSHTGTNFVIGGSTANQGFHIGSSSGNVFKFYKAYVNGTDGSYQWGVNSTNIMTLLGGGNLGLGTATPEANLHIKDSSESKVSIETLGSNDAVLQLTNATLNIEGSNNNSGWTMRLDNSESDGLNYRWQNSSKMTLKTDGKLGLGTINPIKPFHVKNADGASDDCIMLLESGADGISGIDFGDTADADVGSILYSHSTNSMRFDTADTTRMTILSDGKVGIGTTSPSTLLEVNGDTKFGRTEITSAIRLQGELENQFSHSGDNSNLLKRKTYIEFSKTDSQGYTNGTDGARIYAEHGVENTGAADAATNNGSLVLEINDDSEGSNTDRFMVRSSYGSQAFKNIIETTSDGVRFLGQEQSKSTLKEATKTGAEASTQFAMSVQSDGVQFFNSTNAGVLNRNRTPGLDDTDLGAVIYKDSNGPAFIISRKTIPVYVNRNNTHGQSIRFTNNGGYVSSIATGSGVKLRFGIETANDLDGTENGTQRASTNEQRFQIDRFGRGIFNSELYIADANSDVNYSHGTAPNAAITLRRNKADRDIAFQMGGTTNKADITMTTTGLHFDITSGESAEKNFKLEISGTSKLTVGNAGTISSNTIAIQNTSDTSLTTTGGATIAKDLVIGTTTKLKYDEDQGRLGVGTEVPNGHFTGNGVDVVESDDTKVAEVRARGGGQGSGRFYAGQSTTHGGGFQYNGDNNPAMVGDSDRIIFYRRDDGTDHEVFNYKYNNNVVEFKGAVRNRIEEVTANGSTLTLDLRLSNQFVINVTATTDLELSNIAQVPGASYTFVIKNKGNFDIDFPSEMFFRDGDPILTQGGTNSVPKIDILSGMTDGTNLYSAISYDLTGS